LAVATLAVGALTLKFFYGQLQVMQQSLQDGRDESRKSDRHAREQIRALQSQVGAVERQTRDAERAWITIALPTIPTGRIEENKPIEANISFTNTGNTLAHDVLAEGTVQIVRNGNNPNFDYKWAIQTTTGILLKNESLNLSLSRYVHKKSNFPVTSPITPQEFKEMKEGHAYIAIYAKVRYEDVFGIYHWTRRCGWVNAPPPQGTAWGFTAYKCANYSAADQN
jgi:hypothetical protein